MLMLLTGCATGIDYAHLGGQIGAGDCAGARGYVSESMDSYGKNQALLSHMDSGMVGLYCGDYEMSSMGFQMAEDLGRQLWTRSITREGASFLTNDYTIPYSGEDFEKVMVHLFHSLAFALEGRYEPALVEVRKLNQLLVELNAKYEEKSVYREDAFARYLSAMLYEAENPLDMQNLDHAGIDYELGLKVYESYGSEYGVAVPGTFMEDYYRVAEATGRLDGIKLGKPGPGGRNWMSQSEARSMGRIVMVHLSGQVPRKVEDSVVGFVPGGPNMKAVIRPGYAGPVKITDSIMVDPGGPIKVAFPRFLPPEPGCSESALVALSANGGKAVRAQSELVEDIAAIAVKNLHDRMGRVVLKTIMRVVAKQAAISEVARSADNEADRIALKIVGRIVAATTDKADTRSWRTLPGRIYMARAFVRPGTYTVEAEHCGQSSLLAENVKIDPGQTKFVLLEDVY